MATAEVVEPPPNALKALFTPFSDKAANAKLLALCAAGALSSVATLIHDTYLPIYLSEVLGLSNTKVRTSIPLSCNQQQSLYFRGAQLLRSRITLLLPCTPHACCTCIILAMPH